MRIPLLALLAAILSVLTLGPTGRSHAAPQAGKTGPVVLELFTSQGCSSCPPADALLQKLAAEPGVLALSRPVTYWDYLGWKDTLAREENTRKQRAYQAGLSGRRGVYTPQLVVNGRWGAVGSDEQAVRLALRSAGTAAARVRIESAEGERVVVSVAGAAGADILLVGYTPSAQVPIQRGENSGRRVTYTNVVRAEIRLGRAEAEETRLEAGLGPLRQAGATRFAVIVQRGEAGPILGAAAL